MANKVTMPEHKWKEILTDEQFRVTRKKGTERPFSGTFYNHSLNGIYKCVCCGQALFSSESKFDSGTGWPSFDSPIERGRVKTEADESLGMVRIEVVCSRCDSHLGHVFPDGPPETTGLRYCINSVSLDFSTED